MRQIRRFLVFSVFLALFAHTAIAATLIGFRWGNPTDDGILVSLATPLADGKYRLTNANVKSAVDYDVQKGWNRNSGSGIYFSSDPSDSFGDGRHELFIFEIKTPDGTTLPIEHGGLGESVRDYYLHDGKAPPVISRYTDSWFVIARTPTDEEFQKGTQIVFHRATAKDVDLVWNVLQQEAVEGSHRNVPSVVQTFHTRLNDPEYANAIPDDTKAFIQGFLQKASGASACNQLLTGTAN